MSALKDTQNSHLSSRKLSKMILVDYLFYKSQQYDKAAKIAKVIMGCNSYFQNQVFQGAPWTVPSALQEYSFYSGLPLLRNNRTSVHMSEQDHTLKKSNCIWRNGTRKSGEGECWGTWSERKISGNGHTPYGRQN